MALVAGRALQWHWLDVDVPEPTEQWSKRLSFWVELSFCIVDLLEHPLFSWTHCPFFFFFLSQVPVPQANFMEDIEKWLSTDVVSEGLPSWSQQSCQSCLWGWTSGSV